MSKEEASKQAPNPRRRRRIIALASLTALFLALGASYAVYWAAVGRFHESTDDAYVAGNRVPVMTQISGTVVSVLTDDTMRVQRGQTLVRLDDSDARIALQKAKANLAATVRQVSAMYATEKQLRAQVAKQESTLKLARKDYKRNKAMHALGYFTTKSLEHSGTLVNVDGLSLTEAKQALKALQARLGTTDVADNPQVKLAAARVRSAYLALRRTKIVAPVSGYIAKRSVQVGQDVTPGTALMAIVPLHQLWVEANFKESELDKIHIGQPALMHADMFGDSVTFRGKVIGLGAGTGSAFSLLPPQNATGNWIKVVQQVPVRIGIATADLDRHPLRIGLSMEVTVDTGAGKASRVAIFDPGTYTTPVYKAQDSGVSGLIASIIRDNAPGMAGENVASALHLGSDTRGHHGR